MTGSGFYLFKECEEAKLKHFECPGFLFLILGIINIGSIIGVFVISRVYYYNLDPQIIALVVIMITGLFLVISFIIVGAFTKVAEASRLKSEFVGIASHQLRTPLSNIKFSIEYLTSGRIGKLETNQEEQLKIIAQSNKRMLKLVSKLLDLSRIEEGSLEVERQPISLAEITNSLLEELNPLIEDKKIKITKEIPQNLSKVVGDQYRLRMVIQNLIDNAIKYNHAGGSFTIDIKDSGSFVTWGIEDTGIGIPKADQKKVFQRFYRAQKTTLNHSYGTGLGLYIVKAIIEELGGDISFKSEEDKGTKFSFKLPIYNELKVG